METKTQWKCTECGFTVAAQAPPDTCPSCRTQCAFVDVTCYTPECGGSGSGNIDPHLAGNRTRER